MFIRFFGNRTVWFEKSIWTTRGAEEYEVLTNGYVLQAAVWCGHEVGTVSLSKHVSLLATKMSLYALTVGDNHEVTITGSSQFRSGHAPIDHFKNISRHWCKANGTAVVSAVTQKRSQLWRMDLSHSNKWQIFAFRLLSRQPVLEFTN
jgi:hypothetical protein